MLKQLLSTIVISSTVAAGVPNLINSQKATATNNVITDIAKKYESDTPDLPSITLDNFLKDIDASSIGSTLDNEINIKFAIDRSNSATAYIWYQGDHGHDGMVYLYDRAIKAAAKTTLEYIAALTVMSDIAHYYGDNTSMNQKMRYTAIVNDISQIRTLVNKVTSGAGVDLNLNQGVFKDAKTWADNSIDIIKHVESQNYKDDALLYQFNDIDYSNLTTYNGNLHACDDYMYENIELDPSGKDGWYDVEDSFRLGDSNDNQKITISFNNSFNYWLQWAFFSNLDEFDYSNPAGFYVTMT